MTLDVFDEQVLAGMLAQMDRLIENAGITYTQAVNELARMERLSPVEAVYLKLEYERREAGKAH